ncbi:hypothetical protein LF41_1093 [Lysobacter dokdonensis DS-58]|uniref:Uncharacterized protein n=1 Tax=Lysobacter dokdonensis DS-58 TaxID=1300345 RepID=A0A0A2WK43_9GAMM|nr:DUF5985 family protein [Lysobacter dokdonensis]KGQ20556.1 hypothetical protein LF41_1093 [Lysobacter dokdonensis DS-58]
MAFLVYALCALTAAACAVLLFLAWRRSRSRMLWWSGVCFAFLTLANIVLVVDFFVLADRALWPLRHGLSLAAVSALLYGLIFEEP